MANLEKRLKQVHLGQFFKAGTLVSNNASTLASTAADGGADTDSRNENIRNINNLVLDVAEVRDTVDTLLAVLRDNKLIRS